MPIQEKEMLSLSKNARSVGSGIRGDDVALSCVCPGLLKGSVVGTSWKAGQRRGVPTCSAIGSCVITFASFKGGKEERILDFRPPTVQPSGRNKICAVLKSRVTSWPSCQHLFRCTAIYILLPKNEKSVRRG